MKDKIMALLVAKYKGKSHSKTYLEAIAKIIEASGITEESQIDGEIEKLDAIILETASEADRRVTEAVKKAKAPVKKEDKTEDVEEEDGETTTTTKKKKPDTNEAPAWAKDLIDTVNTLKAEKSASTAKEKFAKLIGKDVPEAMYKRIQLPETDEELTALAEEIKTEFKELQQNDANETFGNDKPFSATGGDGKKAASKEELDSVMKDIM